MLTYSILDILFKLKNKKQKTKSLKIQFKKKNISKIIFKYKKYLINKSSFKFKKSREQYSVCKMKKNWFIVDKTIIPKVFEFFLIFFNNSTNNLSNKVFKTEKFKYKLTYFIKNENSPQADCDSSDPDEGDDEVNDIYTPKTFSKK